MTYKTEVKEEIYKLINAFFQEERGNRVTSNNIEGLSLKINILLEKHEVKEGEDKKKEGDSNG